MRKRVKAEEESQRVMSYDQGLNYTFYRTERKKTETSLKLGARLFILSTIVLPCNSLCKKPFWIFYVCVCVSF